MSPPKFLPNLSSDSQENATFEAKNTNPHAPIPKPGEEAKNPRILWMSYMEGPLIKYLHLELALSQVIQEGCEHFEVSSGLAIVPVKPCVTRLRLGRYLWK